MWLSGLLRNKCYLGLSALSALLRNIIVSAATYFITAGKTNLPLMTKPKLLASSLGRVMKAVLSSIMSSKGAPTWIGECAEETCKLKQTYTKLLPVSLSLSHFNGLWEKFFPLQCISLPHLNMQTHTHTLQSLGETYSHTKHFNSSCSRTHWLPLLRNHCLQ